MVMEANLHSIFDAVTVPELRERGTAKWSYVGPDVLAAWVAEMDYPLADEIRSALQQAIARDATGYPPPPAESGLPMACANWLARHHGVIVEPDQVKIVPDILRGLATAINAYSPPESAVVIMTPAYPPFLDTVRAIGRPIVAVPMRWDGARWTFDLERIDGALRAGAATVILCSPHNPLGRVFSRGELSALAKLVEERGARVVADEVHAPLVYPGASHVSYSTVSATAAAHSITLTSASKGWNLAGLKCAQAILTNRADISSWDKLPFVQTHGASILGILANRVAYEQGEAWREAVLSYLDENRHLLVRLLHEWLPQVGYAVPEGTYLAWLDCRALDLEDPAGFFLKHARVALTDGAPFGQPGHGHLRLNFATPHTILTEVVQAMAQALQHVPAQYTDPPTSESPYNTMES